MEDTPLKATDDEDRPLSDLLAEQVEFCDVLVLNKCDLVTENERTDVERILRTLHPGVDVVQTTEGTVEPERVLGTGRFDRDEANNAARWKQAISNGGEASPTDGSHDHHGNETEHDAHNHDHNHEHGHDGEHDHRHPPEEFGVGSFVYERHRPFHPERFHEWLTAFPDTVVRAKGHVWIAGRERYALELSQAGTQIHVDVNGRWAATLPEFQQDSYRESRTDLHWDDEWGDREVRLVFIGAGMNEAAIVDGLDDCLVGRAEMDEDWESLPNPFPGTMGRSRPPMEQRLVLGDRQ